MLWFCTAEAMLLNIVLELSRNLFISIWVREERERDIERKRQINNIAKKQIFGVIMCSFKMIK